MTHPTNLSSSTQNPFFMDREVIVLSKNGIWLSDGIEITHEQTVRLFSKSLREDEKGYFLQVGPETKRVEVEDTPYFIQRLKGDSVQGFELLLNDESREILNPETLDYKPARLTCRVKSNQEAKFLHQAYFDLLKDLQEDQTHYFLEFNSSSSSRKQKIILARKS